jgi:hypothetical protein
VEHGVEENKKHNTVVGTAQSQTIQLTLARGWISSLQMEHDLFNLANKLGLDCWLKYAGRDTITLLENGGLRSMVGGGDKARHPHGTD